MVQEKKLLLFYNQPLKIIFTLFMYTFYTLYNIYLLKGYKEIIPPILTDFWMASKNYILK